MARALTRPAPPAPETPEIPELTKRERDGLAVAARRGHVAFLDAEANYRAAIQHRAKVFAAAIDRGITAADVGRYAQPRHPLHRSQVVRIARYARPDQKGSDQ